MPAIWRIFWMFCFKKVFITFAASIDNVGEFGSCLRVQKGIPMLMLVFACANTIQSVLKTRSLQW